MKYDYSLNLLLNTTLADMKKMLSRITNVLLGLAVIGFIGYKIYIMPKFSDGEKVPGFTTTLINGESFSLDDLNGRYVLLDFWGSWCGPCRVESPALVSLNQKFAKKKFSEASGFDIVSVAIETNENRWKSAINKDQLNWPYHIVQLDRFKGKIATQYGVKEIPTKYLLGTDGSVLMVNPSFGEITEFLEGKNK